MTFPWLPPRSVVVTLLAAISMAATTVGCGNPAAYRVAVEFDNAKGIGPGQLLKISGVNAGRVDAVTLTEQNKALVTVSVQKRFAPFYVDASCRILPEGLIGENFVECRRGSENKAQLADNPDGKGKRISVGATEVPVSLQDVINIFRAPVSERIGIVLNELGLATAGQGDNLNQTLRRANPTLKQVNSVLKLLAQNRRSVGNASRDLNVALKQISDNQSELRSLLRNGDQFVSEVNKSSQQLSSSIRASPGLLNALNGTFSELAAALTLAVPQLESFANNVSSLNKISQNSKELAAVANDSIRPFDRGAGAARSATDSLKVPVANLARTAPVYGDAVTDLNEFTKSFTAAGGVEGALRATVMLSLFSGLHDDDGHLLGIQLLDSSRCYFDKDKTLPGCSHRYGAPANGTVPINDPDRKDGYFPYPFNGAAVDPAWEKMLSGGKVTSDSGAGN